eukprot:1627135-Rhodomonas_salina.1
MSGTAEANAGLLSACHTRGMRCAVLMWRLAVPSAEEREARGERTPGEAHWRDTDERGVMSGSDVEWWLLDQAAVTEVYRRMQVQREMDAMLNQVGALTAGFRSSSVGSGGLRSRV